MKKTQQKVTGYFQKQFAVPKIVKDKILNAAIAFTAIDMRSLRAIEGEGMIKLASVLVEVGAK